MVAQLNAYADGTRKNDVYGRMRDIAGKLTPEERAARAIFPRHALAAFLTVCVETGDLPLLTPLLTFNSPRHQNLTLTR